MKIIDEIIKLAFKLGQLAESIDKFESGGFYHDESIAIKCRLYWDLREKQEKLLEELQNDNH